VAPTTTIYDCLQVHGLPGAPQYYYFCLFLVATTMTFQTRFHATLAMALFTKSFSMSPGLLCWID
jgi:hypothetical protein